MRFSVAAIAGQALCVPCLLVLPVGAGIGTDQVFATMSEGIDLASQSFVRDISVMSCCVE